jgi:hypothetical protein
MYKSNITIAPNIYVRSSVDLQSDERFIKRVYGYRALNLLKARFPKSYAQRFTRAQIEEMKQNVVCRLAKTREHSYGRVRAKSNGKPGEAGSATGGSPVWSCRCEHTSCHAYDKCMALPNALRIVRTEFSESSQAVGFEDKQPDGFGQTAEYGFDHDDCSFEAPHVTVILPILTDILSGGDDEAVSDTALADEIIEDVRIIAEKFNTEPDQRLLIICESTQEVGYFSTILYKNKVRHRIQRSEGYTLSRYIADVFWDYCGEEIEKDAFLMRCSVRINCTDEQANELYEALYELCGEAEIGNEGGLRVSDLADSLSEKAELISECVLNMDDPECLVTISTLDSLSPDDEFDEVLVLEGENSLTMFNAVQDIFGSPPMIIHKESSAGWVFSKSALGRPCRVGLDNYTGEPGTHCLNVELGLWGDVDGKSFLTEQMGDAIRLQLYIAEKIKEGDELTVRKNTDNGGWWFFHNGNVLGEFPQAIMREVQSIEGFPSEFAGFEGVYVKNIVTCVSEKDDLSVPARFRESGIWLGLDITGYAKVLI